MPSGEPVAKKSNKRQEEVVGILGVGLDNEDEHRRITCCEDFLLVGGSEETHERMQDTAIRFSESLEKKGKTLRDTSPAEAFDLLREAMER
jgi:hypothetical protein